MNKLFLVSLFSIVLALNAPGQTATPAGESTPQPTAAAAATATPGDDEDDRSIEREVAKKLKRKFGITIDTDRKSHAKHHDRDHDSDHDESKDDSDDGELGALIAIPIVGIIFSTLFGAPVLVVAAIMLFSYLKSRSLHRTVRMMVEKGQEVPPALFAPPPTVKARSDLRRGVILLMVGLGMMLFFGGVSEWEGGVWSIGVIPFVIGLGYLLMWKLEGKDKAPPLP